MSLSQEAFEYLVSSNERQERVQRVRQACGNLAAILDAELPDGPDKTFVLRELRTCASWSEIAITRNPDGSARRD